MGDAFRHGRGTIYESERVTRRKRIDPRLTAQGWTITEFDPAASLSALNGKAVVELPTDNGPADYALCAGGYVPGVVDASAADISDRG